MNSNKALTIILVIVAAVTLKNFWMGSTPTSELISHANSKNFNSQLKQSTKKHVMVDFYADWCGPCKALTSTLNKLAESYPDSLQVIKINIDESPKLASFYGVESIPCVLYFKEGEETDRYIGRKRYNDYVKWLE